jgi:glycosyltransferase involved in cell wall biosynthesis
VVLVDAAGGLVGLSTRRVRVLRAIARMNMGGPAHHVSLLGGRLDAARFESLLVHGNVQAGEASMAYVAERYGARTEVIPTLGREIRPLADMRTAWQFVRLARRFRPDIVHTHTAKAGLVGRLAALFVRPRPIVIHTYHGHVLEGYFGPVVAGVYRLLERLLGRASDCLIGVSQATVDDLVRLRVAPRSKFRVVPLGLDLEPFARIAPGSGAALRAELGVSDDEILVTYVGRLAPIKQLDLLVRAASRARGTGVPLHLAVVGDGSVRPELEQLSGSLGMGSAIHFLGYRGDMPAIAAATDIAALSSANEGTPVFLIEAGAAACASVATDVGGVRDVVTPETGIVVAAGDEAAFAEALASLAGDPERRRQFGQTARRHVLAGYGADRLVRDVDALYLELLGRRGLA